MRINVDIPDEATVYIKRLTKRGDVELTVEEVKAELAAASLKAIEAQVWEWKLDALREDNNLERRTAHDELKALFPDPVEAPTKSR